MWKSIIHSNYVNNGGISAIIVWTWRDLKQEALASSKANSALVGVWKYNKTAIAGVISPAIVCRQWLNKKRWANSLVFFVWCEIKNYEWDSCCTFALKTKASRNSLISFFLSLAWMLIYSLNWNSASNRYNRADKFDLQHLLIRPGDAPKVNKINAYR